ncbi:hypothetical protein LXL04_029418 [Taraxacum kok-saghyz]
MRARSQPSANFTDVRSQASGSWLPDTRSSHHVTPDLSSFDQYEAYHGDDNIHVGNGKGLPILHIGSSKLHSRITSFSLSNLLHVPEIKQNLLSVQNFCQDNNVYFEFHSSFFTVKDEITHTILLTGPSKGGLYSIQLPRIQSVSKVAFSATRATSTTWHRCLGHPHSQLLKSMLSKYHLPLLDTFRSFDCESCSVGKSSKLHLLPSTYQSSHSKADVYTTFKAFMLTVERQFQTKIKSVQTDWGGEFRNLSKFFSQLGISHQLSCPHTSEQNGTWSAVTATWLKLVSPCWLSPMSHIIFGILPLIRLYILLTVCHPSPTPTPPPLNISLNAPLM